jgi:hypothetical protein
MSSLLVTGAGSLAQEALLALSQFPGPIETIAIAARDTDRLRWLARAVRARSGARGSHLDVQPHAIDWDDPRSLASVLVRTRPRVVLHTASWQSAWTVGRAGGWSELVRGVGYGVTLPLQLVLAARMGRALAGHLPAAQLVNACFPDAVNPLLTRAGIPVACGIGNVAILAAMLGSELRASSAPLRLIAHHAHVAAAISGRPAPVPVRAWRGDALADDEVAGWLATARLPADERLNAVTGAAAVPLLHALADRSLAYRGHAPGPQGLWGGYPIVVDDGVVSLDLPRSESLADAQAHNGAAMAGDGLAVDADGRLGWSPHARAVLDTAGAAVRDTLPGILDDTDFEAMARRVRELRERLATPGSDAM